MSQKSTSKSAFSLIELLVVMVVIGILSTGAVAVYSSYQKRARDTIRTNDLEALRNAVERYKAESDDSYAPDDDDAATLETALVPGYLQKIPLDPGSRSYQYIRDPGDYSFFVFGGYNEQESTPSSTVFIEKGPSNEPLESIGVDGNAGTTPTAGIEFGM